MASNATLRTLKRAAVSSRTIGLSPCSSLPAALPSSSVPALSPISASAPFSTSSVAQAAAPSGRRPVKAPIKKNFGKNRVVQTVKKPEPGERKAFRKRIVLSNNNALEVKDKAVLSPEALLDQASANSIISIPGDLIDRLRSLEAFKPTQAWGLFRSPHVLLRKEAQDVLIKMQQAAQEKTKMRTLITGDKITGKSILVLEAMAYGLTNKWVVIHIPEAMELTNAHTEYSPVPNTADPVQFYQPMYCLNLLQRILAANEAILREIPMAKSYGNLTPNLSHLVVGKSTLYDMVASCKESEFAWITFQALWTELTTIEGRPPVLLSADGVAHFMRMSEYRDPAYNLVHAHDLTLVRLFIDALSGASPMVNGGAVLAALNASGRVTIPSLDLKLAQGRAKLRGESQPKPNPWERNYDVRVEKALADVDVMEVTKLDKPETRVLMEYWAESGMLREKVTEAAVSEKWTLGGGVLGEIEKMALRNLRM
ncbi:mitochondrial ribosomal protein [Ceratocystis lukuohia]|uniref:Small ribosomal subunit protein mS29 n=1 Tax=Ceratocystis lukuohia TaxID=2019550 RepID=A0ABR4MB75_9PEZI